MESYKVKLKKISTFIFDVDGVFTNGQILLYNDDFLRSFNAKDGYAVQYASKMGYLIFIITGGDSKEVKNGLLNLGVNEVHLKSKDKLSVYTDILKRFSISNEEVLYMGDDIPDIPVLKKVGIACCPQDAVSEVKNCSDYQSPYIGGQKCVRDVIEQTLKSQGKWMSNKAFNW